MGVGARREWTRFAAAKASGLQQSRLKAKQRTGTSTSAFVAPGAYCFDVALLSEPPRRIGRAGWFCWHWATGTRPVFGCKIPNSKFFFRHLHGDLNLDEIKNTLRLLFVNCETNLMNLTRL